MRAAAAEKTVSSGGWLSLRHPKSHDCWGVLTDMNDWTRSALTCASGIALGAGSVLLGATLKGPPAIDPRGFVAPPIGSGEPQNPNTLDTTVLVDAVNALSAKVEALTDAHHATRVPIDTANPTGQGATEGLADVSRQLQELASTVALAIENGTPFIPWKGSQEAQMRPLQPGDLVGLKYDDLNEILRTRTFENVFDHLGKPTRLWAHDTRLQCEFSLPNGEFVGMSFINGRVVEAYN